MPIDENRLKADSDKIIDKVDGQLRRAPGAR